MPTAITGMAFVRWREEVYARIAVRPATVADLVMGLRRSEYHVRRALAELAELRRVTAERLELMTVVHHDGWSQELGYFASVYSAVPRTASPARKIPLSTD